MVATVIVQQLTSTAPGVYHTKNSTDGEKSGSRYMTSDQWDGSLTSYPIPIPTNYGGLSGSYWITHCVNCTVGPTTYLKNLRYYQTWSVDSHTDWTLGEGTRGNLKPGVLIGISSSTLDDARLLSQGFLSGQYVQATGVESVHGYILSGTHTWYAGCVHSLSGGMVPVEKFSNLTTAMVVHSGQFIGASATGRSRCIATQVFVGSGATAGTKVDKVATWTYSEC